MTSSISVSVADNSSAVASAVGSTDLWCMLSWVPIKSSSEPIPADMWCYDASTDAVPMVPSSLCTDESNITIALDSKSPHCGSGFGRKTRFTSESFVFFSTKSYSLKCLKKVVCAYFVTLLACSTVIRASESLWSKTVAKPILYKSNLCLSSYLWASSSWESISSPRYVIVSLPAVF